VPVAATLSSFHRDFLIVFPLGSRAALFQNPGELSMVNYSSGELIRAQTRVRIRMA
jgi:hypothetical protein